MLFSFTSTYLTELESLKLNSFVARTGFLVYAAQLLYHRYSFSHTTHTKHPLEKLKMDATPVVIGVIFLVFFTIGVCSLVNLSRKPDPYVDNGKGMGVV